MTDTTTTAPARLATRLAFWAAGAATGCCAPLFPFVKSQIGASESVFGMVLLCLGLGSVIAMPVTGVVATRKGARPIILTSGLGLALILPLLPLSSSAVMAGAVLFVFGACLGTLDVAMNVHGAEVEQREGRALMSGFHASYSVGALLGAGFMTLALWAGLGLFLATLCGALCVGAAMVATRNGLLRARGGAAEPLVRPRGIVLLLAILAGIAFLSEGVVLDWSGLLIIDLDLVSPTSAGLGYILFSIAMVIARLSGDYVVQRLGGFRLLVWGGLIAIAGVVLILTCPWRAGALSGFVLIGLGLANLVPIVFSAAGRQTLMPAGLAVAAVTTTGYAGILLGPALIGFAAEATSLPAAFWLLALLLTAFPLCARRIMRA